MKPAIKHDEGKLPWHLLPSEAIEGTLEVLALGAEKYGPRNWENGLDYSRLFSATMRHLWAWWRGKDKDSDSGLSHLDHAACNVLFLQAYEKRKLTKLDDRPSSNHNLAFSIPEYIAGLTTWRQCKNPKCNQRFLVGPRAGTTRKKFCNDSCRTTFNNLRKHKNFKEKRQ